MARLHILTGLALIALIHTTMSISVQEFFPEIKNNLTKIVWAHATNSQAKLKEALESSEVMMIEADVIWGYNKLNASAPLAAVLAHPPDNSSDLTLYAFMEAIIKHNKENKTKKGIKLDIKSEQALAGAAVSIIGINPLNLPVWLNADILKGPKATDSPQPIDPKKFFDNVNQMIQKEPLLSIGWTTGYVAPVGNETVSGNYTKEHITEMQKLVNETLNRNLSVTYPVRACYAKDIELMKTLLTGTPAKHNPTLTIWSADGDKVDTKQLADLVRAIGVDKVYIDLPKSIRDKLDVSSAFTAKSSMFVVFASMIIALITAKLL